MNMESYWPHRKECEVIMAKRKRWTITSDKFLTPIQVKSLIDYLAMNRDLAMARSNNHQAIRDNYVIRALLETGLREFELCSLLNENFQGQKITVKRGKGGKPRTVLITKATALMLNEWLEVKVKLGYSKNSGEPLFPSRAGGHYSTRGLRRRIKAVFKALSFPKQLSGHSLRHTNCTLLIESKKVSITRIRDNLGHSSLTITDLYSHATGNLDDVDLFSDHASAFKEKSDVSDNKKAGRKRNLVEEFVRKRT